VISIADVDDEGFVRLLAAERSVGGAVGEQLFSHGVSDPCFWAR